MKSLSDVVSGAGLQGYAEIALVIFFVVFIAVTLRVMAMRSRDLDHAAYLPLDDGTESHSPPRDARGRQGGAHP